MLIFENFFKTQSDQNIHQNAQNAPYFLKKIGGASIYPLTVHNTHQNVSIIKCFQKFLYENYPIASIYLYKK